jgi:hypothetical protein
VVGRWLADGGEAGVGISGSLLVLCCKNDFRTAKQKKALTSKEQCRRPRQTRRRKMTESVKVRTRAATKRDRQTDQDTFVVTVCCFTSTIE